MAGSRWMACGLAAAVSASLLAGCGGSGGAEPSGTASGVATRVASGSSAPPAGTGTPSGSRSSTADYPDWPTYHGDAGRSGVSTAMPPASGQLRLRASLKLDGPVYASPTVVGGTIIVATENDSVYAFDQQAHQLWHVSLGKPSPAGERACGNIDPLGITGTPVYDAGTGSVYLVAEHGGAVRHELYALDPATGATRWRAGVDLPGASAADMQQRGALAISGGKVWVPFGAQFGDCGRYKGRIVGLALDGSGTPVVAGPPTERGGGIWNPAGPTVDAGGDLLVVSANGAAFPGDAYDHTNSVLQYDSAGRLVDSFAPSDWASNNAADVGLGSQGVALVGKKWAVLGGKSGPVYVLRQGELGGIGGQVDVLDICRSFGGAAVQGDVVYLPCTDGVRAVRVDNAGKLHVLWHATESINGSPVIGGGRIWVLDYSAGVLHALDPATGRSLSHLDVGTANRFATPALYGRDVLVPTLQGLAVVAAS